MGDDKKIQDTLKTLSAELVEQIRSSRCLESSCHQHPLVGELAFSFCGQSAFLPIGWGLELATFLRVLDSLCVRSKNGERKLRKQNNVSWLNFSNADVDIGYYFRPQICKGCV